MRRLAIQLIAYNLPSPTIQPLPGAGSKSIDDSYIGPKVYNSYLHLAIWISKCFVEAARTLCPNPWACRATAATGECRPCCLTDTSRRPSNSQPRLQQQMPLTTCKATAETEKMDNHDATKRWHLHVQRSCLRGVVWTFFSKR